MPHLLVAGEAGDVGLIPTTDRFGTALADIVRCANCGHMQLDRFPQAPELSEAYAEADSADYLDEEDGQRATARRILERVERYAQPGAIVDLGCWVGFFLDEAVRRGWTGVGIEPSEFAAAHARDRLGLDVREAELLDAELEPGSFAAAFMGDVIEHLPDPHGALRHTQALLGADGILVLALPDAGSRLARAMGRRWWGVIPTHVQYFTRGSIAELLARAGFRPIAISTAPKAFSVRYYLGRVSGYSTVAARALTRCAELGGLAHRQWAPDFRDRMLVIAAVAPAPPPTSAQP